MSKPAHPLPSQGGERYALDSLASLI